MKLKSAIILLCLFCVTQTYAQLNVNVFINGTMAGTYSVNNDQTDAGMWYKKSVFKNLDKLSIEVKGKELNNGAYVRKVEVLDENSKSLFMAAETPTVLGQFLLTDKAVLKRLGKGKQVKLFLLMDPASSKSMAPSKRFFIGNLSAK